MFDAIVRGYKGMGWSGFGAVLVEVAPDAEVPRGPCFREVGSVTRVSDGLEIERAVECLGDHRPCRNIAEGLKDRRVRVGLDDMGLLPRFELLEDWDDDEG